MRACADRERIREFDGDNFFAHDVERLPGPGESWMRLQRLQRDRRSDRSDDGIEEAGFTAKSCRAK